MLQCTIQDLRYMYMYLKVLPWLYSLVYVHRKLKNSIRVYTFVRILVVVFPDMYSGIEVHVYVHLHLYVRDIAT